jgi:hypothetical protein
VRFPRAVSQTAPGRPRVTARPAQRPVSAERGRLRQVMRGNAPQGRVSGSAGLGLSRCPDASGAASTAVERRKASAPEARTDGNIRSCGARRAPSGTAKSVRAFRRSAPLRYLGRVGRAFLKREANLGYQGASRERWPVSAPAKAGEGDHAERGGGGVGLVALTSSKECRRRKRPSHRARARSRSPAVAGRDEGCGAAHD